MTAAAPDVFVIVRDIEDGSSRVYSKNYDTESEAERALAAMRRERERDGFLRFPYRIERRAGVAPSSSLTRSRNPE